MIGSISAAPFFNAPTVAGLNDQTQELLGLLVKQWQAKFPRNLERQMYLDGKNRLKDLQISIPPEIKDQLEVVMGWPEKAVFELGNRIVFDGLVSREGEDDPFGLKRVLHDNRFRVEFPQAVTSSLTYSTSFGTVTPGDTSDGEPEVVFQFHTALWATGIWDRRKRRLRAGLVVGETDAGGRPVELTLLLPDEILVCRKGPKNWILSERHANTLGRVPMEHLPYRPATDRPFGRSRIDRRVMSLTDRAVRVGSRLEVHSELFSAMKLILLGVGADAFTDTSGRQVPLWSFYMGRMSALSRDEEGELPQLEKITAESPEPHISVMRELSSQFSGHTGVPMSALGVSSDNPESADAKTMAREDIISDAERQHDVYGHALHQMLETAVMLRDGLDSAPDGMLDVAVKWRRPDRPTLTARAMAGSQQIAAAPWLAETEVGLELLGLDRQMIDRALSERKRVSALDSLSRLAGGEPPVEGVAADDQPE